jgi:arabinose-5-phosphate isomerase
LENARADQLTQRKSSRSAQLQFAKSVFRVEANAILSLVDKVGAPFLDAVESMHSATGHVIITGIGKPGFIGQKFSATLASIGIQSFFLHPAEAAHGDLGRVRPGDVVVALSNSGTTEEIVRLLLPLKRMKVKLIALTGNQDSPLAQKADIVVDIGTLDEACPMGLVPTASSAALHAMSDALAMTLAWKRSFSTSEYALLHPGGKLGRSVLKVSEVMRTGKSNPLVPETASVSDAIVVMTNTPGRPGATSVVNKKGMLTGIFTDGDLRRLLQKNQLNVNAPISSVMAKNPRCVEAHELVMSATALMREFHVDQLPVIDAKGLAVGFLDVQDLLAERLV